MSAGRVYERDAQGRWLYRGERPGSGWHAHGTFPRRLWTLLAGRLQRITVYKQRWLSPEGTTCHSRPPDDIGSVQSCALVVFVALWGWLSGAAGVHGHEPVNDELAERPSPRTLQRWLRRARRYADETAQALRHAVIERSEPRPVESFLGSDLSPPTDHRRWSDPTQVRSLRNGLELAIVGARALKIPLSLLLAEARCTQPADTNWML